MTIKQAREFLGEEAERLTDEELRAEIDVATMFKDMFFNRLIKKEINDCKKS